MARLRSLVLVVAVLLLAGCSSTAPSEPSAVGPADVLAGFDLSDASEAQAAEISDRVATADEYKAAFHRYRECLRAAGFDLTEVEFKNSVYKYKVPKAVVEDGANTECYVSEFRYTDILWQTSDSAQSNSDTAALIRECLQERGIQPADTVKKLNKQVREAGIELPECLS